MQVTLNLAMSAAADTLVPPLRGRVANAPHLHSGRLSPRRASRCGSHGFAEEDEE